MSLARSAAPRALPSTRVRRAAICLSAILAATSWSTEVHADVDPRQEYDKKIKDAQVITTLGPNLAGDFTSLYTGATTFSVTDASLPSTVGPAVAIGRRFELDPAHNEAWAGTKAIQRMRAFADWDWDIPYMSGVYANDSSTASQYGWEITSTTPEKRCSVLDQKRADNSPALGAPRSFPQPNPQFWPTEFWSGVELNVPGSGKQSLLVANVASARKPTAGGKFHWTTKDDWWFSCLGSTVNGYRGEAFLALAPNGDTYKFNHMSKRWVTQLKEMICATDGIPNPQGDFDGECSTRRMTRKEYMLLPTEVKDRFGNIVTYNWSTHEFARLTSIVGSDGRKIELFYNALGHVALVRDGLRTWKYHYITSTSGMTWLSEVELPDGSRWKYDLALAVPYTYTQSCVDISEPIGCYAPPVISGGSTGSVTHPSGAKVTFYFSVHFKPTDNGMGGGGAYPFGLVKKTIEGPGLSLATWEYRYSPTRYEFVQACATACPRTITVDAISPGNRIVRSTFGIELGVNQGLLLKEEAGQLGAAQFERTNTIAYTSPQGENFSSLQGTNPMSQDINLTGGEVFYSERKLPIKARQTSLQGVQFLWQANAFDAYARPTSLTRGSAGNAGGDRSLTEVTTYRDNTARWVIGQVAEVKAGAVSVSKTDFDPTTDLPSQTYSFGLLQRQFSYRADGSLATIKDAGGNSTALDNWSRGVPRLVTFPTGATRKATVNIDGTLASTTDEMPYTTNYQYDAAGRLNRIQYPTGGAVAWNDLTRSFVQSGTPSYGLPAGHWQQVVQTGNGRTTTFYDARWNPVLTLTEDTGNSASKSFVVRRFDAEGRQEFESYPVPSALDVASALPGTVTEYDALGRVVRIRQDAGNGTTLTTTTEYLSGFRTRVTNPRNLSTTTSYQVLDTPSTEHPVRIEAPADVLTEIERDPFGAPLSITRSGPGA